MGSRILAGRYELVEKIGEGGMAVVFKSRDRLLNRFVAIKILRPEYTKDMMFIESFRRESQIAAGLVHPNIVNVYDVGKEGNIYYIVMELIDGKPLSEIIEEEAPLDPHRAADIAKQIASALSMAHKHQLIHRDVKPHNIMITSEGVAKITDFGIAKVVTNETLVGSKKDAVMGSVHYFSPEQARGGYVDEKSDIYSLGIVLYEMLTGKVPFDGDTAVAVAIKHTNEEMVPPSALVPNIPQDLEDIIKKATNKLQTGRYRNADEMITALNFVKFSRLHSDMPQNNEAEEQPEKKNKLGGLFAKKAPKKPEESVQSAEIPAEDNPEGAGEIAESAAETGEQLGAVSVPSNTVQKKKKKKFNWAYPLVIIIAIALAVPASMVVKAIIGKLPQKAEQIKAPKLVGLDIEEAEKTLEAMGLSISVDLELESKDYPAGTILSQSPDEGAAVKSGQTIKVNVSRGIVDGTVPSLEGKTLANAKHIIESYGYTVGELTEEASEEVPMGSVIRHNPVAGTTLADGEKISLVVSTGGEKDQARRELNLVNMKLDDAKKLTEELGIKLGEPTYKESDTVAEGVIIEMTPAAPHSFIEGDSIEILVSSGPPIADPGSQEANANSVNIYIDYTPAAADVFRMTVTVSDAVGAPRTPYSQVEREKASGGETITVSGSGEEGKVLVFFDNALVAEFDVNFNNGEIH